MEIKKKLLLFLSSLLSLPAYPLDKNVLRTYLYADEWWSNSQLKFEKYDAIPISGGISFYDNENLRGKPAFVLQEQTIRFKGGEICSSRPKAYKKQDVQQIRCKPFICNKTTSSKGEHGYFDLFELEWERFGEYDEPCSRQLDINYYVKRTSGADVYFWVKEAQEKHYFVFEGQQYYPDLYKCKKKNKLDECIIGAESKNDTNHPDNLKKNKFPDLKEFSKISSCFEKSSVKLIHDCLESFTVKSFKDFDSKVGTSIYPEIKPIYWTDEKINELKACAKPGAGVGKQMYKGIHMKCLFIDDKAAVIDYPEAFIKYRPISNDYFSAELPPEPL